MAKPKFWKNPFKWWVYKVVNSIEPENMSHRVRMHVDIPKGQTKGRALIPCAIYSFDHSIDLNPALIRRKDGKKIKDLPLNKRISYDSKKYDVQLTKEEKKLGYRLEELEKCNHCGQRIVIAEVSETRYRSCPDIKVRVADKAKEHLRIPVDFGVRKRDVVSGMWAWLVLDALLAYLVLVVAFKTDPLSLGINAITKTPVIGQIFIWGLASVLLLYLSIMVASIHYKGYKLWQWWRQVKHTLVKARVAN